MRKLALFCIVAMCTGQIAVAEVAPTETRWVKKQLEAAAKGEKAPRSKGAVGGLVDASGLEYFINTNVGLITSESASGSVSDATYSALVAATSALGGTVVMVLDDAFDGYNGVVVNGSTYNMNAAAAGDPECLGTAGDARQLIFADQAIGNLTVSRRVFVPEDDEFIRFLTFVSNDGAGSEMVSLVTANNLGSDDATVITGSSSGDSVATTDDTWVSTFQDYEAGISSDPRLGHVLKGPGDTSLTSVSDFYTNNPVFGYTFEVPAGETRILMNFVTGQPSIADSQAQAAALAALRPAAALACLADADLPRVVNFDPLIVPTLDIPALGPAGLLALALLLVTSAAFLLRRRA